MKVLIYIIQLWFSTSKTTRSINQVKTEMKN